VFDHWIEVLDEAAADGTFLATFTMWVVTGTR
jgi:hypothetical protein